MFRSDRDGLAQEVEELRRERAELRRENEALRADVLARRNPHSFATVNAYKGDVEQMTAGERVALSRQSLTRFPIWAAIALHFGTFGLFSCIHYNLLHGKLPQAERDDPSAAKAVGFSFIPYFQMYWVVFSMLRLTDRLNFQFRLRGLPNAVPRSFMMVCSIMSAIPYLNILIAWTFLWPFAIYYLQRSVNELAARHEPEPTAAAFERVRIGAGVAPADDDAHDLTDDVDLELDDAVDGFGRRASRQVDQ